MMMEQHKLRRKKRRRDANKKSKRRDYSLWADVIITKVQIEKYLKKLKVGKATWFDGVAMEYLRSGGNVCGWLESLLYAWMPGMEGSMLITAAQRKKKWTGILEKNKLKDVDYNLKKTMSNFGAHSLNPNFLFIIFNIKTHCILWKKNQKATEIVQMVKINENSSKLMARSCKLSFQSLKPTYQET